MSSLKTASLKTGFWCLDLGSWCPVINTAFVL